MISCKFIKKLASNRSFLLCHKTVNVGNRKDESFYSFNPLSSVKAVRMTSESNLKFHFRGALVGALVGDCLGAPFEFGDDLEVHDVVKFFDNIQTDDYKNRDPFPFTDDTAMLRSVAQSLINNGKLDSKDLAKRFTEEYFRDPDRGYGRNIKNVFKQLQETNFEDPFGPATQQFNGTGSKGNGGSMRIAPAALFGFNYTETKLLALVTDITRITHSNRLAINGAVLQCMAIHCALKMASTPQTTKSSSHIVNEFVDYLLERLQSIESADNGSHDQPYSQKLMKIKDFVNKSPDQAPSRRKIQTHLGNDVGALESVPAAIYSFLHCFQPVKDVPSKFKAFERTIIYAISLGGDTDTIATMAGSIAGAYYGIETIPSSWVYACEAHEDAIQFADDFEELLKKNGNI